MKSEQYIIAIGASAGGMSQINKFFDYTPLDGVSYIVIQHLSADYRSIMASLLNKHTKLNIQEATNNMTVEANRIYLIPSTSVMTIKDGRLVLTDKAKGVNLTINTFFTSLAEERGSKAIGVILSGTGSDGTEGMKAIKNAGGLLIASDPESSEFIQMPQSAIATGLVDFVGSPEQMPKVIEEYVSEKTGKKYARKEEEDEEKTVTAITNLIKDKLPEDFSGYKKNTILRRIKRRATLHNISDIKSYYHLLMNDSEELQNLSKDFLISVTSFFRDKEAFEVLEKKVIPAIIKNKKDEEIKIWVAGCATGEEAFSIAILVREQLEEANKNNIVKIFATDIDSDAIQFAGKGIYNDSITKNITPERIEKFFISENNGYRVKPLIRQMLIFAHHDLIKNPPYCNMDFISCRNVLIYINPVLQKKILSMLHFGMKYGGFLFLGPSENIMGMGSYLEEVDNKWKIYKNIEAKRIMNFETFVSPALREEKVPVGYFPTINNVKSKSAAPLFSLDASLLVDLGFAGAWIDENYTVLKTFGDTEKFLLKKMFVHHLPDLLSKPLQLAFITASIEANKTTKLTEVKGISVDNIDSPVTLFVKTLTGKNDEAKLLVLFLEEKPAGAVKQNIVFDETLFTHKYTLHLEEELTVTKEKLAVTLEVLHASNENMQSFNEELLSANEEMQSTNEEVQSVNEELQTVNAEYQSKIKELSELNDDLNNYFRSNVNGQIFVNKELLLIKFSPGAFALINIRESDIGRPLSNLSTNIKFETIDEDIREVLKNGGVVTKEIQANNGKWFQVMTMPYLRKGNNLTDGAIVTFNDISEQKQIQEELVRSNKSLKAINADLDNFVYTASHDLLAPINNIDQIIYSLRDLNKNLDSETSQYISLLSTSTSKFRSVIKEMAIVAKMENDMFKFESIDIEEMIKEILASMESKISSESAVVQTLLKVKKINFSKKNLRSIILNLVNNALKFRSPDRFPEIIITIKEFGDYIILSVKDNGIGISKDKIESIFEIYKQLNKTAEGQGLGLFLVKRIMNATGGKVEVESEPDRGTEFKLYIKKEQMTKDY